MDVLYVLLPDDAVNPYIHTFRSHDLSNQILKFYGYFRAAEPLRRYLYIFSEQEDWEFRKREVFAVELTRVADTHADANVAHADADARADTHADANVADAKPFSEIAMHYRVIPQECV
jgi:hypothetical protein